MEQQREIESEVKFQFEIYVVNGSKIFSEIKAEKFL